MSPENFKHCSKCGGEFPPTYEFFSADRTAKSGLYSQCKQCVRARQNAANAANPQHALQKARAWREANRDSVNASQRRYREANREKQSEATRRWQKANPDRVKATRQAYQRNYPERVRASSRRWYEANRSIALATKKHWRESNTDHIKAYSRVYNQTHREAKTAHRKEWRLANLSRDKAVRRAWEQSNRERRSAQRSAWQAENRERRNARMRELRRIDPEASRIRVRLRRARLLGASGTHTAQDIQLIRLAQTDKNGSLRCWWCGCKIDTAYDVDHKTPLVRGGSNGPENLCISCPTCNRSKNSKLPSEFNGRLL